MGRPHIEFLQSQTLPWQPSPWAALAGLSVKILSQDDSTGAATALVRFGPGAMRAGSPAAAASEECLVLDGSLRVNSRECRQDFFLFWPAGQAREAICAGPAGAVVLVFLDRAPDGAAPTGDQGHGGPRIVDTFEMPWECEGMDPAYAAVGLRWKLLRGEAGATDTTMLVACPPHLHPPEWRGPQEVHDCVEEMFLIGGDYLSNVGIMREGAYFWRPSGIAHGPYGTRAGNFALIRTLGHALENNWTVHEVAIDRDGSGVAVIPEALRRRGAASEYRGVRY